MASPSTQTPEKVKSTPPAAQEINDAGIESSDPVDQRIDLLNKRADIFIERMGVSHEKLAALREKIETAQTKAEKNELALEMEKLMNDQTFEKQVELIEEDLLLVEKAEAAFDLIKEMQANPELDLNTIKAKNAAPFITDPELQAAIDEDPLVWAEVKSIAQDGLDVAEVVTSPEFKLDDKDSWAAAAEATGRDIKKTNLDEAFTWMGENKMLTGLAVLGGLWAIKQLFFDEKSNQVNTDNSTSFWKWGLGGLAGLLGLAVINDNMDGALMDTTLGILGIDKKTRDKATELADRTKAELASAGEASGEAGEKLAEVASAGLENMGESYKGLFLDIADDFGESAPEIKKLIQDHLDQNKNPDLVSADFWLDSGNLILDIFSSLKEKGWPFAVSGAAIMMWNGTKWTYYHAGSTVAETASDFITGEWSDMASTYLVGAAPFIGVGFAKNGLAGARGGLAFPVTFVQKHISAAKTTWRAANHAGRTVRLGKMAIDEHKAKMKYASRDYLGAKDKAAVDKARAMAKLEYLHAKKAYLKGVGLSTKNIDSFIKASENKLRSILSDLKFDPKEIGHVLEDVEKSGVNNMGKNTKLEASLRRASLSAREKIGIGLEKGQAAISKGKEKLLAKAKDKMMKFVETNKKIMAVSAAALTLATIKILGKRAGTAVAGAFVPVAGWAVTAVSAGLLVNDICDIAPDIYHAMTGPDVEKILGKKRLNAEVASLELDGKSDGEILKYLQARGITDLEALKDIDAEEILNACQNANFKITRKNMPGVEHWKMEEGNLVDLQLIS